MILFYSKGQKFLWNKVYAKYDQDYLETFFDMTDADGRRWKRTDLTGAGTRNGETGKLWKGIDITAKGRHWGNPPSVLDEYEANGRIHWPTKEDGMPELVTALRCLPLDVILAASFIREEKINCLEYLDRWKSRRAKRAQNTPHKTEDITIELSLDAITNSNFQTLLQNQRYLLEAA